MTVSTFDQPTESTIFVGSSVDLQGLADSSIADPLIADGNVSFYGHMTGLIVANEQGVEQPVIQKWSGTGAGLTELGYNEPMALMAVTIQNTSQQTITLPIGQIVSSASGVQYQIVQKPRQEEGWSNSSTGTGSAGYYTVAPGQSLTLMTQALVDGPSGNLPDNQITTIDVPGASITGSTLILGTTAWAVGTVTLTNSSNSDQTIYERTTFYGSGGTYQVTVDPTVQGFVSTDADESSGYYILKAGSTITVPIASINAITATTPNGIVQQQISATAAPDSITSSVPLPPGVTLASSSALTLTGVSAPSQQGVLDVFGSHSGLLTDAVTSYFTSNLGYNPTEADVNSFNDNIWTSQDLQNWESYVDSARSVGYLNLAPMMSEFETVDFATSSATQYARAGALYGGGIAFDMPPWFFLARDDAYRQSCEAEIKWATANGLRSSITLSPISGNDENFLAQTQAMIAMLTAAGALPTQFVIKDEGVTGNSTIYSTSDPNSFNNIAQYLSQIQLTPSNSESNLETQGSSGRPDDLMTGVEQTASIIGGSPLRLFVNSQIFSESKLNVATLSVTVGDSRIGTFSEMYSMGSVSADGTSYTITGDMATITDGLQGLSFSAALNTAGVATVTETVTDKAGTISGKTTLSVDNSLSLSGLPATQTTVGFQFLDQNLQVGSSSSTGLLTAQVRLSDTSIGTFWNFSKGLISSDGTTLTFSGTAAEIQAELTGLQFISTPSVIGIETETITVTDGTEVVSAATNVSVSNPWGIAIAGVPLSDHISPGAEDTPYADVLITKTSAPTQVLSLTVTLPEGAASFASTNVGQVSQSGLNYTFSGNVSQIQSALRDLNVVVSSNTTTSFENMSININGHYSQTLLNESAGSQLPDVTITGVPSTLTAVGGSSLQLYSNAELGDANSLEQITAIVALSNVGQGTLSTNAAGVLSSDASTLTLVGSVGNVESELSSVQFTPKGGVSGNASVKLTIVDGTGKTSASSSLSVLNAPVPVSVTALPGQSPALPITIAVSSSYGLEALNGGSVSGGSFSAVGSPSDVSAAVAGLIEGMATSALPANLAMAIHGSGMRVVDSGNGNDTVTSSGGNMIVTGGGITTVEAGKWDTIAAGAGAVSASSSQGLLFLGGGSGFDTVTAGGGDIYGGSAGHSVLVGKTGLIGLHAGGANDTLVGGGQSVMYAAPGADTTIRMTSGDTAVGVDGAQIDGPLSGTKLSNIFLVSGSETVAGGGGDMVVHEGTGASAIYLGTGHTTVIGYSGKDLISVGAGSVVQVSHNLAVETISLVNQQSNGSQVDLLSFNPINDQLCLSGYGSQSVKTALASQVATSAGTTIHLADGSSILFAGVSHVSATDITFS